MGDVVFEYRSYIFDVEPQRVFEALTTPSDIEVHMLGTGPSSSWNEGDKVLWKSDASGEFEDLGQQVISVVPGSFIEYSWHSIQPMHRPLFDSDEAYEKARNETTTVRWSMEGVEDDVLTGTMLTLRHTGFDSAESVMLQGVSDGWVFFVSSLKTYLER
ncbi:SRPBCC domain-containing protein [Corynebacterium sp.]|uniref:SRPBCC domain-containing protein n=1 Tax=Corynebacterium sp. TaxID=1720 RepID=UPI003B3A55ED